MTEDGHRQAAEQLRSTLARLVLPDDVRAYAELAFGVATHLLAVGAQRRHGIHRDNHEGLGRWLRERGHIHQADILTELENIRTSRWYGRHGDGTVARRLDELLAELEAWALA